MGGDGGPKKPGQPYWLIYVGLLIGGILLLADTLPILPLQKISAKLGIGMIYSAFALFIANGKPAGVIATIIIWIAVLTTFLFH
jgi:hypothetical protein